MRLEFLVGDEITAGFKRQTDIYRWDDLDQWDDDSETTPSFLEKLAEEIKMRHRSNQAPNNALEHQEANILPVPQFPTDQDSIWRVKVKVMPQPLSS